MYAVSPSPSLSLSPSLSPSPSPSPSLSPSPSPSPPFSHHGHRAVQQALFCTGSFFGLDGAADEEWGKIVNGTEKGERFILAPFHLRACLGGGAKARWIARGSNAAAAVYASKYAVLTCACRCFHSVHSNVHPRANHRCTAASLRYRPKRPLPTKPPAHVFTRSCCITGVDVPP